MKDIRSEVYDALADIMFENNPTKEEMEYAIEWFMVHFFEDEDPREILEGTARCDLEDIAIGRELVTEENVGDFSSSELIDMILEEEEI